MAISDFMSNNDKARSIIQAGSEIAGAAVGGALGFIAGGPVPAAGAAVAGVTLTRVLGDVASRFLSERETTRIGGVAAIAASIIDERLKRGDELRNDGFFEESSTNERSPADEVFEGTLLAAKNSYEEKKLLHLGVLFSNVAFSQDCPPEEANFYIKITESLTYSQFVLLRLFALKDNPFKLREQDYKAGTQTTYATISLLHSIQELCALNLVIMQRPSEPNHTIVIGINIICPSYMQLAVGGERLHNLLGLQVVGNEDLESVAKWLR
jgi:hypothetical protein